MLPTKYWAEMGWRDFAAADMSKVVAVLPVAAIEQHGPHLPVGVDTFINEGYLARAVERVPADLPVLFLPLQAIGKSNEHIEYPGTLTFSMETVTRAWTEIGDSVARTGCRKLIFMNSHGGNVAVLAAVVRDLRVRHGMLAVHAGWHALGYPDGMFSASERAHGIHGGDAETSLMLAFKPANGAHERGARFRQFRGFDRTGISSGSASPSRSPSAGWPTTSTSSARPATPRRPPPPRARPARIMGSRVSSSFCATCTLSMSRGLAMGRSPGNSGLEHPTGGLLN